VTPQEEQLLNSLADRVNQTQLQEKDQDAEAFLNKTLGPNPDAIYILAQTVLVQNIALEQAKAQVAQLQQQAQQTQEQTPQPARTTSFLGGLFGHHDSPPPQQAYTPPAPLVQQAYVPPPPPPAYSQPQYAPMVTGQPSFLRGAMQTAAGVAAGALAFEGVEAVLHGLAGFGHPGFGMGGPGFGMGAFGMGPGVGMMGAGFERPVEETVVNNYYDQPAPGHENFSQSGFAGGEPEHFHESADRLSDQGGAQLSNASYNTINENQSNFDDSSSGADPGFDNSTLDDGSGFDESGSGFDDGGGFDSGGGGDVV